MLVVGDLLTAEEHEPVPPEHLDELGLLLVGERPGEVDAADLHAHDRGKLSSLQCAHDESVGRRAGAGRSRGSQRKLGQSDRSISG